MKRHKRATLMLIAMVLVLGLSFSALAEGDQPLIGIIQIVAHPALDAARDGFIQGMADLGYKDGEQIRVDAQNANGNMDILSAIADRFIAENAALVLAIATPSAQTMMGKTESIPILATAVTDYVAARLVKSNEAPGYNVSGTTDMNPIKEQIALIKRMAPEAKTVGMIYTASEDNSVTQARAAKARIEEAGMVFEEVTVHSSNDVQQAAQSLVEKVDALYIPTDNTVASSLSIVYEEAVKRKVPIFCSEAGQLLAGGMATIGINYYDLGYQTAAMAVEVLGGADIATMPIQAQSKFEYAINKTACDEIGLQIPEDLLPFAKEMGQE